MKRFIFGFFGLIMAVALISTTALAVSNEQTCDDSMSTASLSSGTNLKVNGVTYFIPGGATSTVGYGYNNAYTYVYDCQLACNWMYNYHKDSALPCGSYCGVVDGSFGSNTYNGIIGFQNWNNTRMSGWPQLAEDGICGDSTWTRLAALCF